MPRKKRWIAGHSHTSGSPREKTRTPSSSRITHEITTTGETRVAELTGGAIREFTITPAQYGLGWHTQAELKGGDSAFNAKALRDMLSGAPGAYRDTVLMNAGAGLVVAGVAADLKQGVALAAQSIDSGKALARLEKLVQVSNA